ncbi:MAG: class I tRNA ligase family protein, partial [Patescibacteria group bacterium]
LTKVGREQTNTSAEKLKREKIDLIISSPLERTRETAEIVRTKIDLSPEALLTDERLREVGFGVFDGRPITEYWAAFPSPKERFIHAPAGGETLQKVKIRVGEFLDEIEKKYQNKKILIVAHEDSLWMLMSAAEGKTTEEALALKNSSKDFFRNAEVKSMEFIPIPCNQDYELDLHRPYIDEVVLKKDGKEFFRTKEVMDVWLDSGAMPFAQDHYPFENRKWVDGPGYPADYISEAIDQTRGWFYTLHAVGVLMGKGLAYKNVICLGHLLDANGKKMSKSIGNIVDPWEMIEKYGVDTLRLWMYSINQPGESKNFDEKTVQLLHQQVFGLLYNVLAFYELYPAPEQARYGASRDKIKSSHVLDKWILTRLDELTEFSTTSLDKYKLLEPVRATKDFINDLSTWYLRRSRERIKEGDADAKQTLYFVLKNLAKLMAPFAPFAAEDIWSRLHSQSRIHDSPGESGLSVHLCSWPLRKIKIFSFGATKVLKDMEAVRSIVTLGLEARQKAGIKVRQPLNRLEIVAEKLSDAHLEIIKDELNIKNIDYLLKIKIGIQKVTLETKITSELQDEGNYRELVRAIQDMRKKQGFTPSDVIALSVATGEDGKKLIQKFETELKKAVLASVVKFGAGEGEEVKIEELVFKVKIDKI